VVNGFQQIKSTSSVEPSSAEIKPKATGETSTANTLSTGETSTANTLSLAQGQAN
jgi:hypothetical protein